MRRTLFLRVGLVASLAITGGVACTGSSSSGPVGLAYWQGDPYFVLVDAKNVYWTTQLDGSIWQLPLGGGAPVPIGSGCEPSLAKDDAFVYFGTTNICASTTNLVTLTSSSIMRVPIGGGQTTILASGAIDAAAVAVDDTTLYWCDLGDGTTGAVMSVPKAGGPVTTLAPAQSMPVAITVDDTSVYWLDDGAAKNEFTDGTVMKAPKTGGPATTLASGLRSPTDIAVDATHVYWTVGLPAGGGTVMKAPKAGGPTTTIASGQDFPAGIAVDATRVYWTTNDGVMTAPIGGGVPLQLAPSPCAQSLAIDATNVYWAAGGTSVACDDGTIMTAPK